MYDSQEDKDEEEEEEEESTNDDAANNDTDAANSAIVVGDSDVMWSDAFLTLCLRLARNDSTLQFINDWKNDVGLQNRGHVWTVTELMLLGKSIMGNTHLKSLSFRMDACLCKACHRFMQAMQQGIAQSELIALQMVQVCCQFQVQMLQGVRQCSSLERLEMCDEGIVNLKILAQLLQPQHNDDPDTDTDHHPHESQPTIPRLTNASITARMCQLTHLGLRNCHIDNLDMLALSLGLANNRTLRFLNLEKNRIGNVGIVYLCQHYFGTTTAIWLPTTTKQGNSEMDATHCSLFELDLTWNQIGAYGASLLLQASTRYPKFRKLLLTGNGGIGHTGLRLMGEQLGRSSLQYLEIHQVVHVDMPWTEWSQRPESQAAAMALANGLRQNTTLIQFHVGANVLGPPGAQAILQAVAVHPCLQTLGYACDGSLGFKGLQWVGHELGRTRLKQIHLDGIILPWPERTNKAACRAGRALMNGVKQNVHMTHFTLIGMDDTYLTPIEFFANVNQVCRPLFRDPTITAAVWPLVLAQFHHPSHTRQPQPPQQQQQHRHHHQQQHHHRHRQQQHHVTEKTTSHLYVCLREQPWLVMTTTSKAMATA